MKLTESRKNIITEILNADEERAKKLLTLEPNEAVAKINSLGHDFTVEELNEYAEIIRSSAKEMDMEALSNAAGGTGFDDVEEDSIAVALIGAGTAIVTAVINKGGPW